MRQTQEKQKIAWEKTAIKVELRDKHSREWRKIGANDNIDGKDLVKKQFTRISLGMPEHYEYANGEVKITVEDKSGEIERFASPMVFKPTPWGLLILNFEIPISLDSRIGKDGKIYVRKFQFKLNDKLLTELSVPEDFLVEDFLNKSNKFGFVKI